MEERGREKGKVTCDVVMAGSMLLGVNVGGGMRSTSGSQDPHTATGRHFHRRFRKALPLGLN